MKKNLLTLSLFLIGATTFFAKAQTIPNADFESWLSGIPNGWVVFDLYGTDITQSTDHYSGTYSVKLKPSDPTLIMLLYVPYISSHTISHYLNGYIKSNLVNSDSFEVDAYYLRNSDQKMAEGYELTSASRTTWTPFHITINIPSNYTPDKFGVRLSLTGSTSSYVLIDNLSFSNTPIGSELGTALYNSIKNVPDQTINSSLFPNPANKNAEIDFMLVSPSNVTINIFDVTGRSVKNILNENRVSGVQKIPVNLEDLQSGIYFYTISGNGFSETKKFVISK